VCVERFALRSQQAAAVGDRPGSFDVICKRSGITVTVPAEKSIYDALADAGVEVDSSCLEGPCGTCETKVLEGRPDHRDSLLTEPEREKARVMYVCVSRARSERLVLDLSCNACQKNLTSVSTRRTLFRRGGHWLIDQEKR
jgi:ferredoxin